MVIFFKLFFFFSLKKQKTVIVIVFREGKNVVFCSFNKVPRYITSLCCCFFFGKKWFLKNNFRDLILIIIFRILAVTSDNT